MDDAPGLLPRPPRAPREARHHNVKEELEELERLQILVDGANDKYMLQIFMREAAALYDESRAGPFFYEIIQRAGDPGFGYGNFRALFESIERAQQGDGAEQEASHDRPQSAGLLPAKPHTVLARRRRASSSTRRCTRAAASAGAFTYFYHRYPVTPHARGRRDERGFAPPRGRRAGALPAAPSALLSDRSPAGGQLLDRRVRRSSSTRTSTISSRAPTESDDAYFANGDGDELWFVHEGGARARVAVRLARREGGRLRWVPQVAHPPLAPRRRPSCALMVLRGARRRRRARASSATRWGSSRWTRRTRIATSSARAGPSRRPTSAGRAARALREEGGDVSRGTRSSTPPMDVVGWDGFVYPCAFAIEKYQPKTGSMHLPPTIHATFAGPGFLVCSFVPRVTDTHPQAIPCPYPHSSVDCDEVILYLRGNFTSRRGVGPGAHLAAPGGHRARAASRRVRGEHRHEADRRDGGDGATRTRRSLPTAQAANIEDAGYHESWAVEV